MIKRLGLIVVAFLAGLLAAAGEAAAHPHVWVTIKSELVYAPDGAVTGMRHAWTFDEMFSSFATQGLDTKTKGVFTREDLAPLADVNVQSLKEFDYFTKAKADGKTAEFVAPVDYWLDYADNALTLHFTLPFKAPVKAQNLDLAIYDGTWFVGFSFAEKDAVTLVNAPAACKFATVGADDAQTQNKSLSESFFNQLDPSSSFGAQFANRILVKCP